MQIARDKGPLHSELGLTIRSVSLVGMLSCICDEQHEGPSLPSHGYVRHSLSGETHLPSKLSSQHYCPGYPSDRANSFHTFLVSIFYYEYSSIIATKKVS